MSQTYSTEMVLSQAEDLPALSTTAIKLISMTSDPNLSRQEVADLLKLDEVLSAAVFKYANSAAVGARLRFTNMMDVIDYIGINAIKNIVILVASKQVIKDPALWLRSVFISGSCSKLCSMLDESRAFTDLCFMLALFHNLGNLVFRTNFLDDYKSIQAEANPIERLKLEKKTFGINHFEVSAKILENWDFEPKLVALVKSQQDYGKFSKENLLVEICARIFELKEVSQDSIDALLQGTKLSKLINKFGLKDLEFDEELVNGFFDEAEASTSAW